MGALDHLTGFAGKAQTVKERESTDAEKLAAVDSLIKQAEEFKTKATGLGYEISDEEAIDKMGTVLGMAAPIVSGAKARTDPEWKYKQSLGLSAGAGGLLGLLRGLAKSKHPGTAAAKLSIRGLLAGGTAGTLAHILGKTFKKKDSEEEEVIE